LRLLVALTFVSTAWQLNYRAYDPCVDIDYVQPFRKHYMHHPEWIAEGPTADDYITYHPECEMRDAAGRHVAQTILAGTYGAFGLRYLRALRDGFTGEPMALCEPAALCIPCQQLRDAVDRASGAHDPYRVAIGTFNHLGPVDRKVTDVSAKRITASVNQAHFELFDVPAFKDA
jgi:hypothetical protein